MKIWNFLLLLGVIILFYSCQKDEINNLDNNPSLELTVMQDASEVKLSWTKTKVTTFDEYIVVRSVDSIPDSFEDISSSIITIINDYDENETIDQNVPFVDRVYYRVFVDIGDRMLVSNLTSLDFNRIIIPISIDQVTIDKENDVVYLNDPNQGRLIKYNYTEEKEELSANINGDFLSRLKFGKHAGQPELYTIENSSDIHIYDANNLAITAILPTSNFLYDITYADGLLHVTQNDFNPSLVVFDRETLALTETYAFSDGFDERRIGVSDDGRVVVEASFFEVDIYEFDDGRNLINHDNVFISNFTSLLPEVVVSNNSQHFITNQFGEVYSPGQNLVFVNAFTNGFSDFAFSENDDRLFAVELEPFGSFALNTYSFPALQLLESKPINFNISPRRVFVDGNTLLLLSRVNDGFGIRTLIEKFEI